MNAVTRLAVHQKLTDAHKCAKDALGEDFDRVVAPFINTIRELCREQKWSPLKACIVLCEAAEGENFGQAEATMAMAAVVEIEGGLVDLVGELRGEDDDE